ncbi:hypothetical protein SAMN05192529_1246 [Arachidicoccus rhizosphaerae]|uniref:Uncharacterized protein n=1 Tax=Arachidicoccus rhizosphaerae TaxID=551991 RepID=A0A1H4BSC8_9BACT|nr:hypothetical protein SAMN05192529_1246 [Arachidicoccus rhizosphaerae]
MYNKIDKRKLYWLIYSPNRIYCYNNYPTLAFIETLKLEKVQYSEHRSLHKRGRFAKSAGK